MYRPTRHSWLAPLIRLLVAFGASFVIGYLLVCWVLGVSP
jgi:hypothetical protein